MKLRRALKILARVVFFSFLAWALFLVVFFAAASRCQKNFRSIHDAPTTSQLAAIGKLSNYRRTEETTYLSFPEWYLVFNPQEYAQWMHVNRPSAYPYFGSIGQFWSSYAEVYGLTRRTYPFNFGDNLMEVVIGTSFTIEYTFKGLYENTLGRIGEWTSSGARTEEDDFAARIAEEYGAFIPTRPWFEYAFGRAFVRLWTENSLRGNHFARKLERRLFLSIEYSGKAAYAAVIRLASHAVYGVADDELSLLATKVTSNALAVPGVKKLNELEDGSVILSVPHYQGFTDTVPLLARLGMDFIDVAGCDEMLITVRAPAEWKYTLSNGRELFSQPLTFDLSAKRVAIQVSIKTLADLLRELDRQHLQVEHLFDY